MNNDINYKNSPLHGVGLKTLLVEMVDHYGFEILFAYLSINCFKTNPSIDSSVKFLKKTDWAREKVEAFYLYQFKNLPRASSEQFALSPRDRIVPDDQEPGEPAELSLEDAERLREKRDKKSAARGDGKGFRFGKSSDNEGNTYSKDRKNTRTPNDDAKSSSTSKAPSESNVQPWANWENRSKR
ncbi:VF530 family DNA-binding protein [Teredinibacter haidensis]|uniref:VF530 family protein n=1 Tax=Teredinibacter haidensis TaxID=2731755 RepID=UPI0009491081|nr:VF530 family DNA-binding protein [Teredinibacter haidensis]